ncbi:Acetyltransferase [Brachybacterium faecium]|nr:Acetyltransferase [Brachybacterium faecium]
MNLIEEDLRLYEKEANGELKAEVTFSPVSDSVWSLDHTYVNPAYRGQGLAQQLVEAAVAKARREGKQIIPSCSYAKAQFERVPEYADIWYHISK